MDYEFNGFDNVTIWYGSSSASIALISDSSYLNDLADILDDANVEVSALIIESKCD